jgi:acetyl esterase
MPLDSGVAGILDLLKSRAAPPISEGTPERARAMFEAMTVGTRRPEITPEVDSVEDVSDGPVPIRLYRPQDEPGPTAIAYFHGGGFVIGSIETHDLQARALCRATGAIVASAEYRLAPEHPWPAGVEDAIAVTKWALDRFGRVAVAGDSAGANLSAIAAQQLRDQVVAQLLVYPPTDLCEDNQNRFPSREENGDGYFLTRDDMRYFHEHYLNGRPDCRDPRVSPLYGDLAGLPPAVIATAEFDPLRDEGDAYADALRAAGVHVDHLRCDGLIHGFAGFAVASRACATASDEMYTRFSALL